MKIALNIVELVAIVAVAVKPSTTG